MSFTLFSISGKQLKSFSNFLQKKSFVKLSFLVVFCLLLFSSNSFSQAVPKFTIGIEEAESVDDVAVTLEIVALLTVLTLAPSIIIMMTSFIRIVIVINFLKQALATQNAPPNQVVMGLSLFLTFFIMGPTLNKINEDAIQPYMAEEIKIDVAFENAKGPIRDFMLRQTREEELALFIRTSRLDNPQTIDDVPFSVIIPSFILSEVRTAFIIGFLIYVPFLVIDMVVASVLMSMGMMMLPPMMVSLPCKLILFVLVDGWHMVIQQVILSFK